MEIKEMKKMKKNFPILIILFCLGIIFLYLSEYHSIEGSGSFQEEGIEDGYTQRLEERLSDMISGIDGAGKAKVMITLAGSTRYEFATEKTTESGIDESTVTTFLMQKDSTGSSSPILIKTNAPEILGVSVVCPGASSTRVRQKILELVAGTLNLTQNKIYVTN